jgi:hypothetical protein
MVINAIQSIKKYKSLQDYSWHKFLNNEEFHEKLNIFYGENGCGKTSICNIFKSVSQNKEFKRAKPEEVEIEIDGNTHKYNGAWDASVARDSILFFDREFVDENVHLGRNRGTQQGEQEQSSGKLIIEFDAEAIKLRDVREKLYLVRKEKEAESQKFEQQNKTALSFGLDEDDEKHFRKYKSKTDTALAKDRETLDGARGDADRKIKEDKKLLKETQEIQAIAAIDEVDDGVEISAQSDYQNLMDFDLREQVKFNAEAALIEKLQQHKAFFERGFEVRKTHPKQCPFCQAKDQEEGIRNIVSIYNGLYDETYKKQRQIFERTKGALVEELKTIEETLKSFDLSSIFIPLKKLSEKYEMKGLYVVAEEEEYRKSPSLKKIVELRRKIETLEKPNKENISVAYTDAAIETEAASKFFDNLRKFVDSKNRIIASFKNENTDAKVAGRIAKNETAVSNLKAELDFITSSKIQKMKNTLDKQKQLDRLNKAFEKARDEHRKAREVYDTYCSDAAFPKILSKIESYFENFRFSFKLKPATSERHTGATKEFPLAFKVLDADGNERDLKGGFI